MQINKNNKARGELLNCPTNVDVFGCCCSKEAALEKMKLNYKVKTNEKK